MIILCRTIVFYKSTKVLKKYQSGKYLDGTWLESEAILVPVFVPVFVQESLDVSQMMRRENRADDILLEHTHLLTQHRQPNDGVMYDSISQEN